VPNYQPVNTIVNGDMVEFGKFTINYISFFTIISTLFTHISIADAITAYSGHDDAFPLGPEAQPLTTEKALLLTDEVSTPVSEKKSTLY